MNRSRKDIIVAFIKISPLSVRPIRREEVGAQKAVSLAGSFAFIDLQQTKILLITIKILRIILVFILTVSRQIVMCLKLSGIKQAWKQVFVVIFASFFEPD